MAAIEARSLSKNFNGLKAVNSINLNVKEGEIFGFLGPNGAGKTTTLKILTTLLRPTGGDAFVAGFDVNKQRSQVREKIGVLFQEPSLDIRLTARENLMFHGIFYNMDRVTIDAKIKELLKWVELTGRENDVVKKFSGGMKRRLELARAVMHEPKILFMDEPTIGLDPQSRAKVWEYLVKLRERKGVTIFMTTHYLDEAEVCDRVAIIDEGKIVDCDTPKALILKYNSQNLNEVFLKLTGRDIREEEVQQAARPGNFWLPGK